MQLVIDNSSGRVLAKYEDSNLIPMDNYGDVEVVQWDGEFNHVLDEDGSLPRDPRPGPSKRHLSQRLNHRPSRRACLEMIYQDQKNGTTTYVDALQEIDARFPDPEAKP